MPDFSKGKIYIIYNTSAPVFKVYYGSTARTIRERMKEHRNKKTCESRSIIESGTYDYEILEHYPCNNEHELEDREAEYIVNNWDSCVNKTIPGAMRRAGGRKKYDQVRGKTPKRKEQKKEYRKKNAEKINARRRKQKITCNLCGATYRRDSIARHKKSKTCRAFVQSEVKNVLDDLINQIC